MYQSKNPARMGNFASMMRKNFHLGTTVETDYGGLTNTHSKAPDPLHRMEVMRYLHHLGFTTYITIEPVMEFSRDFASLLKDAHPDYIFIGADSKNNGLPEPSKEDLPLLLEHLQLFTKVKIKDNLQRLLK